MKKKLYCYVDETGQDTGGKLFIVAVVITETERDELSAQCENIEQATTKGTRKWHKATYDTRAAYIQQIIKHLSIRYALTYSIFRSVTDYDTTTVRAIVNAVNTRKPQEEYTTLVYVDALPRSKRFEYGRALRKLGIPTRKVQGVARDESNALIRLADAVAGFVRDVLQDETDEEMKRLFQRAKHKGVLVEVR